LNRFFVSNLKVKEKRRGRVTGFYVNTAKLGRIGTCMLAASCLVQGRLTNRDSKRQIEDKLHQMVSIPDDNVNIQGLCIPGLTEDTVQSRAPVR